MGKKRLVIVRTKKNQPPRHVAMVNRGHSHVRMQGGIACDQASDQVAEKVVSVSPLAAVSFGRNWHSGLSWFDHEVRAKRAASVFNL